MKTQKALGIQALSYYGWRVPSCRLISEAENLPHYTDAPVFVRPCPMRPRHGFVDSRVCTTAAEIREVWDAARAADPEAELVIMTPIDAVCSAVLAGGRLAIGPGHDGATSGHDVQELRIIPMKFEDKMLEMAGLKGDDSPYLEYVSGTVRGVYGVKTYPVQLRAGPNLPASVDFIPSKMVVTNIVTPHDDLCRWEAEVPTFPQGTVVVAPGGSLASHAAVHCVIHGVPYITSWTPAIGETIAPTAGADFKLDTDAFLRGSGVADARLTTDVNDSCRLSVLILHQWAALRNSNAATASKLLGFACRTLARAGVSICAGEMRHYSLKLKRQRQSRVSRSARIDSTLRASLSAQRRALSTAATAFSLPGWNGGFGGKAWIECASAVDRLWRAQSEELIEADLVSALNRVVNVAHNNGALLTKLVDSDYLNRAAAAPTYLLIDRLDQLFSVLTAEASPAKRLPKGTSIKRPKPVTYKRIHVHTEPGGIKAHLWNPGDEYVSHHMFAIPEVMAWVDAQPKTSRSRYSNSGKMYVPIPLDKPIEAKSDKVLAAIQTAMKAGSK